MEYVRDGKHQRAAAQARRIAELSLALAERCEGAIATAHLLDAKQWAELANEIGQRKSSSAKSSTRSRVQDKAEDDSADSEWRVDERPDVTFDDIAGMQDAKSSIFEMVIYPLRAPEKSKALGISPGGGVLIYGPPGNGKTMLGKAIAGELKCPFFYASGAQIRSKWHGESEQRLSRLLQEAQACETAVLFLDEVEGLLPKRGGNSQVDNRIVTQFLADVGGFKDNENTLLILGATNKPWSIDEAVFRTGRFDEKIYVGPPDPDARRAIIETALEGVAVAEDVNSAALATELDNFSGSDIVGLISTAKRSALGRSIRDESEPLLSAVDIGEARERVPSSITDRMLKQYEKFREQRFCGE